MICWPQGLIENWPAVLEAVATLLLVIAAGFQWWTMRQQAQQERDRWKREDLFQRLQWFDSHFNSPAMLIVRAKFGKSMLDDEHLQDTLSRPLGDARTVICFFTQVAERWCKKELELTDIEIVFGDYIVMLCAKFKKHLEDEEKSNKHKHLFELNAQLQATETQRWIKDAADASVILVQENFWQREAALLNKN